MMALVPDTLDLQVQVCEFLIDWCLKQNRSFLRKKIEVRLARILFQRMDYKRAVDML